jgi:hypothetical protein
LPLVILSPSLLVILTLNEVKGKNLTPLRPVLSEVEGVNSAKNLIVPRIAFSSNLKRLPRPDLSGLAMTTNDVVPLLI